MEILKSSGIRFTDCEYLNDKSEYIHIQIPLKTAFEEVKGELFDTDFPEMIESYITNKYDCPEFVSENPELGFKGLKYHNTRHYVFCASIDKDSLNMWNYYVKNESYMGYNVGLSVGGIVDNISRIIGSQVKLFYGQVIYNDKDKIEILKKMIKKVDSDLHNTLSRLETYEDREIASQEIFGDLFAYIQN
jgi:hypothetical protein